MSRFALGLSLAATLASGQALAADLLQWQDNSLTYLNGIDFKVDPPKQQTVTFEHASGWSFGDLFIFVDGIKYNTEATNGAGDGHTFYGEISPRLSLGKISGADLSFGPVKDVLLAATYEFGEDDVDSYLLGPAVDLNIPGFDYFQLNTYLRTTDGRRDGDNVWQITPVWSYTIPVGDSDLVIDGFMDWVVDNDDSYHANLHFNPQIKYDLAKAMGWGKRFYVGVEYDYWSDKYGIDDDGFVGSEILGGTDQSAISLLAKAHF
ncbi:outer membrane protein OmpK [Aquipseudomonas alcaligenes]|uniref:Membrane protein n=1 Tax=Aquipseudomonas alcaligenes TaxID=43263 RepID=A0AA37FKY3_AQUAC|nr:outer membrane protein OmpK [Pseudomonas alcaligenes]BCR24928.1 membrane protein [Pseudomonas alcaligenes]GIZ65958.1 membrane protein [Pseudomonas alcaligenes]GIZ70449.1 membrane protein [Pseudomonas alcaligenes]GIZ74802.1 membrane protein [Pseudomonas alcaligenes]GIZ78972.1 membrane protein [Pseudomonas alcaligenes]